MTFIINEEWKCLECPLHKRSPENFMETYKKDSVHKVVKLDDRFVYLGSEEQSYGIPFELAKECFEKVSSDTCA